MNTQRVSRGNACPWQSHTERKVCGPEALSVASSAGTPGITGVARSAETRHESQGELPLERVVAPCGIWELSSSSDRRALDVVDGHGLLEGLGPHYSRRTPDSKTFTGVGREIVLVTACGRAVWACVYQRTPMARGTGASRGRSAATDQRARYIWRNMVFRNEGAGLSSDLIRSATERTYEEWIKRYGSLPAERLRTEIDVRRVRSRNPGFCYLRAGWVKDRIVRGKLYLWAPERPAD